MKIQKKVAFVIKFTRPVQELLPYLVGQEMLFRIPAMQSFEALNLANKHEVLAVLDAAGYITGSNFNWQLDSRVYMQVKDTLENQIALRLDLKGEKKVPAVFTLSTTFKARLGPFPLESKRTQVKSLFVFFRSLCQKHHPDLILESIGVFFKEQHMAQVPKVSPEAFLRWFNQKFNKQK